MAKRKKSGLFSLSNLFNLAAIVLGVVAICMIALTSLNLEGNVFGLTGTTGYTGIEVVFGAKTENYEYILFSFMNLLPYILVLVGVLALVLKVLGKLNSGIVSIVVTVAFVAAGVLFVLVPQLTVLSEGFANAIKAANVFTEVVKKTLGTGAIISAACSFAAGVSTLVAMFMKKK